LSNYLFNGRADSLKMPYSVTTLEMKNGNGLSFDANLYYLLQNNNQRFDFLELNDKNKNITLGAVVTFK